MDGANEFFDRQLGKREYVPGPFVAVSVANINKPVQKQGHGFVTAVRKGLVGLMVVYSNERYSIGQTVWVETDATKMAWAAGDFQFKVCEGPVFALCPESYVRLVTTV
jgi:hypothetical protein